MHLRYGGPRILAPLDVVMSDPSKRAKLAASGFLLRVYGLGLMV